MDTERKSCCASLCFVHVFNSPILPSLFVVILKTPETLPESMEKFVQFEYKNVAPSALLFLVSLFKFLKILRLNGA